MGSEIQGCGMTFNMRYIGAKYPYFILYRRGSCLKRNDEHCILRPLYKLLLVLLFTFRFRPYDAKKPSKTEFDSGLTMTSSPLTTTAPTKITEGQTYAYFSTF